MHTRSIPSLLTDLARSLNRTPDDFLDAYGSGEAIAVVEGEMLQGFAFAHALSGRKRRPLDSPVRKARAIDFVWAAPSLGDVTPIMRRKVLENLMKRLRDCQLILSVEAAGILAEAPTPTTFAALPRSLRFLAMSAFGIPHVEAEDRAKALARNVVVVDATPALDPAPHLCGTHPVAPHEIAEDRRDA